MTIAARDAGRDALAAVGRSGRLDLVVGVCRGRSEVTHAYGEIPLKIAPVFRPAAGPVQVMLLQPTAGLFGGDRTVLRVAVESGARVMLTSQAALQIHPSEDRVAQQQIDLHVQTGADAWYLNDPAIPFARSRWRQRVAIAVEPGARLAWWDGVMAGRIASGERWAFASADIELTLGLAGRLAYLERFTIEPAIASPTGAWTMADYSYLATALVYDERLGADARAALAAALGDDVELAAAVDEPVPHLFVARVLARTGPAFRKAQQRYLTALFGLKGEPTPDLRKL